MIGWTPLAPRIAPLGPKQLPALEDDGVRGVVVLALLEWIKELARTGMAWPPSPAWGTTMICSARSATIR
jgi:hypothetical protein